ncbi:MAG: cupin domain-containing protein [Bacteroidia bacterium]|nr:cupin domain-containing protein [Bacteroidia bacterium]
MKILVFLFALCSLTLVSQNNYSSLDTIKAPASYDNIYARPLYKDTAEVSSYVIFIKSEVKMHKHIDHAEHVVVLAGNGEMTLGEKKFLVKKGDVIFIPKNTFHGVKTTSKTPLKVLSVQAPYFDGKDRVMKEQ